MKTDYEFIKDKFDRSKIAAPESINEEFVLDKISDIKPKQSKKPIITGLSVAAAVALFTAVAFVVTSVIGNAPKPVTVKSDTAILSNFASAGDVKKALREIRKNLPKTSVGLNGDVVEEYAYDEKGNYLSDIDSAAGSGAGSAKSSLDYGHNSTYTQYTNVDEADTVKTDGRYIYYLDSSSDLTVFSAEGKNSKKLAKIKPTSSYCSFRDFYIHNNKLIAVEDYYRSDSSDDIDYSKVRFGTTVEVFDISDVKSIRSLDIFSQSGSYCSSRMIGKMMYVVSNHTAYDENDLPYAVKNKGATSDEAAPDELPCGDIYSVQNPSNTNFLVVSSINTDNGAQANRTKAILGSADTVYCNTEHLFVTATEYEFSSHNGYYYYESLPSTSTQIVKVDLTNELKFTATAKVDGYIDNQYAMDEKDGYLRIAATYPYNKSGNRIQSNRLYIFDKNLKKAGETESFAENESIKAVRYIGDTAYVITYEETDPLFVIDASDVKSPKILGEVKISGFSTMLVPVDDSTLLGIGYHTQDEAADDIDMEIEEGVKLALFDVSDKANPKVLDEKIFKNYESQVQFNPKALLLNFERNDYTIPYVRWDYYDDDDIRNTQYGVINFKVENKKLKVIDEYVSQKFIDKDDDYAELERCVYVDNYIYMLVTDYNYYGDSRAVIDAAEYK